MGCNVHTIPSELIIRDELLSVATATKRRRVGEYATDDQFAEAFGVVRRVQKMPSVLLIAAPGVPTATKVDPPHVMDFQEIVSSGVVAIDHVYESVLDITRP